MCADSVDLEDFLNYVEHVIQPDESMKILYNIMSNILSIFPNDMLSKDRIKYIKDYELLHLPTILGLLSYEIGLNSLYLVSGRFNPESVYPFSPSTIHYGLKMLKGYLPQNFINRWQKRLSNYRDPQSVALDGIMAAFDVRKKALIFTIPSVVSVIFPPYTEFTKKTYETTLWFFS